MPLTSNQLVLLVEIGRTGSLARAALNLVVTPPAVSQQLARIERDIVRRWSIAVRVVLA